LRLNDGASGQNPMTTAAIVAAAVITFANRSCGYFPYFLTALPIDGPALPRSSGVMTGRSASVRHRFPL